MKTAIGFALGCMTCYGFLTREPMLALVAALGLLLALAAEFMEGDDDD